MEPAPTRNITDSASLTIWGSWSPYLNLYTVPASSAAVTDKLELGASPYSAVKLGLSDANTVVAIWAGASQTVKLARKTGSVWAATVSLGTGAPASESDLDVVVNADGSDAVA